MTENGQQILLLSQALRTCLNWIFQYCFEKKFFFLSICVCVCVWRFLCYFSAQFKVKDSIHYCIRHFIRKRIGKGIIVLQLINNKVE